MEEEEDDNDECGRDGRVSEMLRQVEAGEVLVLPPPLDPSFSKEKEECSSCRSYTY